MGPGSPRERSRIKDLLAGAREREHAVNLGGATREREPVSARASRRFGLEDVVHTGAVDECAIAQTEHDQAR